MPMHVKTKEILKLREQGFTLQAIGKQFNISKQRVSIILSALQKHGHSKKPDLEILTRNKFCRKKWWCTHNNIPFELIYEDITWPKYCPALGIELNYNTEARADDNATFDQIIPKLGYIRGNVAIISWKANKLKCNGTLEQFKGIIKYLESMALTNNI